MVKRIGIVILILALAVAVSAEKSWWKFPIFGKDNTHTTFRIEAPASGNQWGTFSIYLWSGASGNARVKVFSGGAEITAGGGWMLEPGMGITRDIVFDSLRVIKGAAADTLNYFAGRQFP